MVPFPDERRLTVVRWTIAAGTVACAVFCRPLWLTERTYPHAPLFDALPLLLPPPFDVILVLAMAALFFVTAFRPRAKWAAYAYFGCFALLVLGDQSRAQPWLYQFTLMLVILTFAPTPRSAVNMCRLLLVGLYFWSGMHKINNGFLQGTFPWLWQPISDVFPSTVGLPPFLGPIIPFIELGLGLSLLFPRVRPVAAAGLFGMHVFILGVLGPWARNWNSVIWPWNLAMMVLVPVLFLYSTDPARRILWDRPHRLHGAVGALALVMPLFSLFGWWDLFLSFSLYSGNPVYADLRMSTAVQSRLDPEPQRFARPDGATFVLSFDEWSFSVFDLPAYPTERVLLKIARRFCPLAPARTNDHLYLEFSRGATWGYRNGWIRVVGYEELCGPAPAAITSR